MSLKNILMYRFFCSFQKQNRSTKFASPPPEVIDVKEENDEEMLDGLLSVLKQEPDFVPKEEKDEEKKEKTKKKSSGKRKKTENGETKKAKKSKKAIKDEPV